MAATQLSLLGLIPLELHSALIERLTGQTERAEAYSLDEELYIRGESATPTDDNVLRLRALRTVSNGNKTVWSMQVLQKPEPARLSPEMLVRGVIECSVEEGCHPRKLVSAFGFPRQAAKLHQRGVRFQRGSIQVDVYQLYSSPLAPTPIEGGASNYIVSVTTRCANPTRPSTAPGGGGAAATTGGAAASGGGGAGGGAGGGPSAQELKAVAMRAMLEMQNSVLKGLVDVARVE